MGSVGIRIRAAIDSVWNKSGGDHWLPVPNVVDCPCTYSEIAYICVSYVIALALVGYHSTNGPVEFSPEFVLEAMLLGV